MVSLKTEFITIGIYGNFDVRNLEWKIDKINAFKKFAPNEKQTILYFRKNDIEEFNLKECCIQCDFTTTNLFVYLENPESRFGKIIDEEPRDRRYRNISNSFCY
jgi:hypothetical protein